MNWWSAPIIGFIELTSIISVLPPDYTDRLTYNELSLGTTLSYKWRCFLCSHTVIFFRGKENKQPNNKKTTNVETIKNSPDVKIAWAECKWNSDNMVMYIVCHQGFLYHLLISIDKQLSLYAWKMPFSAQLFTLIYNVIYKNTVFHILYACQILL